MDFVNASETVSLRSIFTHFGFKIRAFRTGSEILLGYEVGKYIGKLMGKAVDYDISVSKDVLVSEEYAFVHGEGVNFGADLSNIELADIRRRKIFYFPGTVESVFLSTDTDEQVVYTFDSNTRVNRILHGDNRSSGYISLLGYLMVRSFLKGLKELPDVTIGQDNYNQTELEYVHLFVLMRYGNKLFDTGLTVNYSSGQGFQPEWEAYVAEKRQRGHMIRPYTTVDKYRHLRRNFQVGDVVLLYTRSRKGATSATANRLDSCYPGVISYYDENSIKVDYYPNITTTLTHYRALNEVNEDMEEENRKSVYSPEDYTRYIKSHMSFSLTEVGIGDCTYLEKHFIVFPPDTDGTYQYITTPNGADYVWLPTLDTIFAVFEDRGIEYDRERYLQKHFSTSEPIWSTYQRALQAHQESRNQG